MFQSEEGSLTDSARTEPSHPAEALETWNKEEERCSGSHSVFPFISLLEAEKQKQKATATAKAMVIFLFALFRLRLALIAEG